MQTSDNNAPLTDTEIERANLYAKQIDIDIKQFEALLELPRSMRVWMERMEAGAQAEYDRQREENPDA